MTRLCLLAGLMLLLTAGWAQDDRAAVRGRESAREPSSESLPRELDDLARSYKPGIAIPRLAAERSALQVGRRDRFWVADDNPPRHFEIEAEIRLVTRHAYWYVQSGMEESDAALRRASTSFERMIYPRVRQLVGAESFPGFDNDPRVTILGGAIPGVAGYVSSADGYSREAGPFSNEREIVYINIRSLDIGSPIYLGVLAHEFTHIVHSGVNGRELTWLKEGLADAVSSLVVPERGTSYAAYLAHTDLPLTAWADGPAGSEYYEGAALFVRYLFDRFGEGALYRLLSEEGVGFDRLDRALGRISRTSTFDSLFKEWTVAIVSGGTSSAGVPRYQTPLEGSPRPIRLASGARIDQSVAQFGTDYIEVSDPSEALEFVGQPAVPTVRVQPKSGAAMWHGGRVDGSVATLTRSVDLSGVGVAELRFWTWYDLEKDYDFAYVSASRDDGRSWTLLTAPGMSFDNGTGNNLGSGFTGLSAQAQWAQVSVDLGPFTGGPALLRFSYVTDDAITRDGIVLDDIEVVPLAGLEGAEGPQSDWSSQGWTRTTADVPQNWAVQVVTFDGPGVAVDSVAVDAQGRGSWAPGPRKVDREIVIVSGLTRETLQAASYVLQTSRTGIS